jgi:hypothetical protein
MNAPPLIMRLHIKREGRMGIRLWLPLFLIYPLLAALALLLLPLVLVAALILLPLGWSRAIILIYPRLYSVICALRELEVDFQKKDERMFFSFK